MYTAKGASVSMARLQFPYVSVKCYEMEQELSLFILCIILF